MTTESTSGAPLASDPCPISFRPGQLFAGKYFYFKLRLVRMSVCRGNQTRAGDE